MAAPKGKSVKLPLKLRLKAWWEGYDPEDIKKRMGHPADDQAGNSDTTITDEPLEPETPPKEQDPSDEWNDDNINIAQYIWGEGYCGPGGPDYIVSLSKLLALSPEMSMLQIGAELGGPARVLADKFGVWMTGYESSPLLVEKGQEMSKMAGLDKKAALFHYDPDTVDEFERKFDRALAKEALFTIENKQQIIDAIEDKLKPGGLILITDYFLGSDATVGKDAYTEWKVGERHNPYPILEDEMKDMLKKCRLQVRVSEDISGQYVDMINQAWAGADQVAANLAKQENGTRLIQTLMREAEFWTRRKKMLESGDLKLVRMVANKKESGPGGMSDW